MKLSISLVVVFVATGMDSCAAFEGKPNIIFIMADDLGYGDLGCYGQKNIATPNIDSMAAQGLRFTQCYAGTTVCAPTRCVLMTGKHTGHARVCGNSGWQGETRQRGLISRAGIGSDRRQTLRGSYSNCEQSGALHIVSTWASQHGLTLGQVAVDCQKDRERKGGPHS